MLALIIAVGGSTAYALPGTNSVDSGDIINGEVKTPDVGTSAVTSAKILNGTVTTNDVADGTLTGTDVANESLAGTDVANESLGAVDIGPNSVGGSEVVSGAVGGDELENFHIHDGNVATINDPLERDGDWHQGNSTASCTAGEQLVGWYADWLSAGDEHATKEILPNFVTNSVGAQGITDDGGTEQFRVTAVCVSN